MITRQFPLLVVHIAVFVFLLSSQVFSFTIHSKSWCPSGIYLEKVSQAYPDTLWRRLTSSVPRRELAINDLTVAIESEFQLLLGASSSGKSTVLRLILGETPLKGRVRVCAIDDPSITPPRPILLEERPPYDNSRSVQTILTETMNQLLIRKDLSDLEIGNSFLRDLVEIFELPLQERPSNLSPSENYRIRLAEACLQSSLHSMKVDTISGPLPAPILLLDEWMDKEASMTVQKVQVSLDRLAKRGAVVVCVTHKPHLFQKGTKPPIILSRGSILPSGPYY
jgi:ABC-type ATPase involved in cell division